MTTFFAEFEIVLRHMGAVYWFPLVIAAPTLKDAKDLYARLRAGLEEQFLIKHCSEPIRMVAAMNGQRIEELFKRRAVGPVAVLNIDEYRFRDLPGASDLTVDERFVVAVEEGAFLDGDVIASIQQRTMPIYPLGPSTRHNPSEILAIKIMSPPGAAASEVSDCG